MAKLARAALAHFIDAEFNSTPLTPTWYRLGKDIQDLTVELNSSTESSTNILDETTVTDNGYEPSVDVDTYYCDPEDAIYEKLKDIVFNRKSAGACATKCLEVIIDKTSAPYDAWQEDVVITPTSYGGATGGVRIYFTINFNGNRKKGTVTVSDGVPTFTEAGA